jgi:SAM-dependent methyltransferase
VLDLGCGAGRALMLARARGAEVAGLDASEPLLRIARSRLPGARIEQGDLEALPFADSSFDVVTGFNSLQFASDIPGALREAGRVCRPGGTVTMCVWGTRDVCESVATTIAAIMALMPPPPGPPPVPARPPLATPGVIEGMMREAGLDPVTAQDVDCPFEFRDVETAVRCFLSPGLPPPVRQLGDERLRQAVLGTLGPFTRPDGSVLQKNRFHWVMATRPK